MNASREAPMKFFRTSPPQTLAEWLDLATKRLSVPARRRISIEIKAHYAESIKAHLAEGMSEPEAHSTGLNALGDARAANRRFRKSHLSKWDEKAIQGRMFFASVYTPIFSLVAFAYFLFASHLFRNAELDHSITNSRLLVILPLGICFWFVRPLVCVFLARRDGMRRNLRVLLLLQLFGGDVVGALPLAILLIAFGRSQYTWFDAFWFIYFIVTTFPYLRLWRRLGIVTDASREISRAKARTRLYIDFLLDR